MNKRIYLAGPISGMTFDQSEHWRDLFADMMPDGIDCYSPLRQKHILRDVGVIEGSYSNLTPLSTDRGIMTRDFDDCTKSDLVVINLLEAIDRVSIGTMMELAWCFQARIPTVVIMQKIGNVHDHPMVCEAISFRVESIGEAVEVAKAFLLPSWAHTARAASHQNVLKDHRAWAASKLA